MASRNETPPDQGEGSEGADHRSQLPFAADPGQTEATDRIGLISSLDELPPVSAYLNRVGAIAVNFRRAEKRVGSEGYQKSIGSAEFDSDGVVTIVGDLEAPTDDEQDAITTAFRKATFPKITTMIAIPEPPPGVRLSDPYVSTCHNLAGEIVMLQQRYDTQDGGKGFVPWTRWSDGKWRKMEPDVLPFYGTPGYEKKSTLFIHEGAKAARRIKRFQSGHEDWGNHPWRDKLEHGHHIGFLGGVFAVNRSDWAGIAKHSWRRVVIVADNDDLGVQAARQIARKFSGEVEIVIFDQQFPAHFDLADDWPSEQFDERKRFIGPTMRDCALPATQATRELPPTRRGGAPRAVIRDEFASQWVFVADPLRIVQRSHPSRLLRPDPAPPHAGLRSKRLGSCRSTKKRPAVLLSCRTLLHVLGGEFRASSVRVRMTKVHDIAHRLLSPPTTSRNLREHHHLSLPQ